MLNKVQIIGNLGRDPESRSFANGGQVVNLRIATTKKWKDRNTGEVRENTQWHSIAIFADHACNYAMQYLKKGSKVYVEGALETRKWQDQSGQDRYSTEVVVRPYDGQIVGLDRANGGGQRDQGGQQGHGGQQGGQQGYSGPGSYQDDRNTGAGSQGGSYADMDDEIPF
jgi:single-strand DNA-binding protein